MGIEKRNPRSQEDVEMHRRIQLDEEQSLNRCVSDHRIKDQQPVTES